MIKKLCILFLVFFLGGFAWAFDFGFIVNQHIDLGNQNPEDINFNYRGDFFPRFSFLTGETGSFIVSAGLTLGNDPEFHYVPELLRTELSMNFGALGFRAGRFGYSTPLYFITEGLFDGIQLTHSSSAGRFGFGAWYTGLLYKENLNINMTAYDRRINSALLEYDDFFNTYFASKRLLASLDWGHPSIRELVRLNMALTAQIDLNDPENFKEGEEKFNSQYFTLKAAMPFNRFYFEAGSSFGISQSGPDHDLMFACEFGIFWMPVSDINSRLSLKGLLTSGHSGELFGPFIPVTVKNPGNILNFEVTGLTVLSLDYSARLTSTLGGSITASCFINNDDSSFGAEVFTRLVWSPFSDLQFILGGGAFIPANGDNDKPVWRIDLTAIMALF